MGKAAETLANSALAGAGSAASGVIQTGMGLLLEGHNDRRQLRQQGKLNDQQWQYDQRAMDYNYQKQLQMWKDTSYGAQMEQLEAAGLNAGLVYGMNGAGGATTGSGGGGGVKAPQAPSGGGEIMGLMQQRAQMGLLDAQIENIKADTNKKNVEATKTAGVDTQLTGTQIENLTQDIQESKQKTALAEVQTELAEIDKNFKTDTYKANVAGLKYNTDIALNQLNILKNESIISENTWSQKIDIVTAEAANILLRNELTKRDISNKEADTDLKRQNIAKIVQDMQTQIKQLTQTDRGLDQKDQDIIIQQARNKLIELGIWVGAGSKVLGDAIDILKPNKYVNVNTKE